MALYAEDPSPAPVAPEQVRNTLAKLRAEPYRGRVVVCDIDGCPVAYAFLISFWSNELGGEVCVIDELFVVPASRSRGLATALFARLANREHALWPARAVALALEVTPHNARARALYERLGFCGENVAMRKLVN
ncbi:MAG: GNAT family N-acetyltransferase [Candidatus Binataceae bacterium]